MKYIKPACYCLLALVLVISLGSCKKSGSTTKSLLGQWTEPANPGGGARSLTFNSDGSFVAFFTQYSPTPPTNTSVTFNGTFSIKGDSLLTHVNSVTLNDGSSDKPVTTATTQKLYEYATIKITNNKLLINYTTYPADWPVPTQATFTKVQPE